MYIIRLLDIKASRKLKYHHFRKIYISCGQQTLTVICYNYQVGFCSTRDEILCCGEGAVALHDRK